MSSNRYNYAKVYSEDPDDHELTEVALNQEEVAEPQQQQISEATPSAPELSQDSQIAPPASEPPAFNEAEQSQTAPPAASIIAIENSNDGVFSNSVAVENPPKYDEDVLPSYNEALGGSSVLARFGVTLGSDDDTDVYDGRRVGSGWIFFFSTLISWVFGILGFACVYMMSQTHASKMGARAGLGLMAIQFGFYIRKYYYLAKSVVDESGSEGTENVQLSADAEEFSVWLSYLFMILGWFIFVKALMEFVRLRQAVRASIN
jgi:hypothetical protein